MFKRILCPVDFTSFSHHALERAVAIARRYGASVTGVHVVPKDPASAASLEGARPLWTSDDLTRMESHVLTRLQEVGAPGPAAVAVLGDPATEITRLAMSLPADLIVIGSQGRCGIAHSACGSVTAQVLSHAPVPVITVPPEPDPGSKERRGGFRRIACAVDFSPASLTALQYAGALAEAGRAEMFITHVLQPDSALAAGAEGVASLDAGGAHDVWTRRLHQAASELPRGAEVRERLLVGDPADAILHLAAEERCDLIVIGGHRGNPPGCAMNAIVTRSRCPVLVARFAREGRSRPDGGAEIAYAGNDFQEAR